MAGSIDMIYIGEREDRKRAIAKWLDVRGNYVRLPNNIFGVTNLHIDALENADPPIAYTKATQEHVNGQDPTVQS